MSPGKDAETELKTINMSNRNTANIAFLVRGLSICTRHWQTQCTANQVNYMVHVSTKTSFWGKNFLSVSHRP